MKINCPHCGEEIELNIDVCEKTDGATLPSEHGSQDDDGRLLLDKLIGRFNKVLEQRGYRAVNTTMEVRSYLFWAFNFARNQYNENMWAFTPETYPLVYDYRGSDTNDDGTAYIAMQAWLMASILAELVPDYGQTTNTQTELFKLAYEIGGGSRYPLYNSKVLKADPYAMREAASVIYAICRGDKNISADIDKYRTELGGKAIPASDWDGLGYANEMLFDAQGRRGYRMTNLGYLVNTQLFLPSSPAPRVDGTTVCEQPQPWEQGQPVELFNVDTENYVMDERINSFFVENYNMMSQTPLIMWNSYSKEKQNRLVNVAAIPPCTYMYMFGKPKNVRFDGIKNKTYDGSVYAKYYTFSETAEETGLQLTGPFSDLPDMYRYNVSQKNARELLIERITKIADDFRFPTQDPNYGRCRPGCKPTRQGGELNPVHGSAENEIYNVDLTAMVADTEAQRVTMLHEDGFAADSPRSYVSGHSAQIWMLALLFTQMDNDNTDRSQNWVRRAYEYSINRSVGRFHWNSDVIYGRLFGAMALPIINAMSGLQDGLKAVRDYVLNPTQIQQGDWRVGIIIKNETGAPIQSTGEIRLYVGNHIGVNTYLPNAKVGTVYTFEVGETDFSAYDVHAMLNGDNIPPVDYDGAVINDVRFYDYRHWNNVDAGFNATLATNDPRCSSVISKMGATYVIKITKM